MDVKENMPRFLDNSADINSLKHQPLAKMNISSYLWDNEHWLQSVKGSHGWQS